MKTSRPLIALLTLLTSGSAIADVRVSKIFSSNMVLQRDKPVTVWGTADNGEEIAVKVAGQAVTTTAKDGHWKVSLEALPAGGPHELKVSGSNTIVFRNVLVGDVWICGGQSNMDYDVQAYLRWPGEIGESYSAIVRDSAAYEDLRVVLMKKAAALPDETIVPVEDDTVFQGQWQTCSEAVTPRMSATGFVFAQRLQAHLQIPIGLIDANKGGSPVQTWYAPESLRILDSPRDVMRNMYNAMIRTYRHFPVKGVIWYQGESNARVVAGSLSYEEEFQAMIRGWRHDFKDPGLPFLFVQLAAYERNPYQHGVTYPILRDSQAAALNLKNTGMAVAIDLGDPSNIHPPHKIPLSERLVLAARKVAYGEDLVFSGPIFRELTINGRHAEVRFDHVGSGLVAREVELAGRKLSSKRLVGFQIAGSDQVFHDATAAIVGDRVRLDSPAVKAPVAVRYAYRGFPYANLYNREGLPASPFRTDTFEIRMDQLKVDLYNRRLYLPRELSRMRMTIEQKQKVAAIHDRHITKSVEKKILALRAAYEKASKKSGRNSPEFKAALAEYRACVATAIEPIGSAVKAAGIFR
jgi:sialate O-acetylesterase